MALTEKYQSVADFAKTVGVQVANFHEEGGKLVFNASAPTPYLKNVVFDKFKDVSNAPTLDDVTANISVEDDSVYHRHTVQSGETLSKISKHYYDDANLYNHIFEANRDQLSSADLIKVDQVLVIPKK